MEEFIKKINNSFSIKGISLNETQCKKFCEYFKLLSYWNDKINLTSIIEEDEVIEKHFFDSVVACPFIPNNAKVIDLGSGAGFPGVPIKIMREDVAITLVDSVNKKVNFLNEVISKLNLKNVCAVHTRIEDFASKVDIRESFDIVVSRAVSRLNVLCEYALPFLKIGGSLIAYKSVESEEELKEAKKAITVLGGELEEINDVSFGAYKRKLILIKKVNKSDKKYPRKANKPRLNPIT